MNILTVLHSHICGGAEVHAVSLMSSLARKGHNVAFAGPRDSWLAEKAEECGIKLIHVPMHGMTDPFSLFLLGKAVLRHRPDILHAHLVRGTHYATITGRVLGIPTIATAHSTISYKRFHRAHRIIAVSQAVKDTLVARKIESSRITRIYHGIPDCFVLRKEKQDIRRNLGIKEDECAFCMVARFIPDKGHDFLLRALSGLQDRHWKIFLAGDDTGKWATEMKALVMDRGLENHVVFLGFKKNISRVLAGMDMLVAPSRREALSISIIEAMSMGLPVIGTRTGGIPEAVRHGENGLLVEKENTKELLEAISYLAAHPEVRHAHGLKGRQIYLRQFSVEKMVDRHVEVYRSINRRSSAGSSLSFRERQQINI
jgi:glycosyltransferase involved in cell wall biosynthesis